MSQETGFPCKKCGTIWMDCGECESDTCIAMGLKEWVQNDLYEELIHMPLWTLSAFGHLKDGDIIKGSDVVCKLIKYLIQKHIEKSPYAGNLKQFTYTWSVSEFIPLIKTAVVQSKKVIYPDCNKT